MLVSSYGLQRTAEQDSVLMGALAGVQASNPALFADMQHGMAPNTDPALTAQQLPQPEYGCAAAGEDLARRLESVLEFGGSASRGHVEGRGALAPWSAHAPI